MVNTAEFARAAVAACRYPPTGNRGCGTRRAVGYGAKPFDAYLKEAEQDPLVIVQIEHIDAVRNLDEILKVPGLGSICIGPYDLSGSMGKLGQTSDPEVVQVIEEICEKTRRAGVMLGAFGTPFSVWQKRGIQWTALCSDSSSMFSHSKKVLGDVQKEQGQ
jgi:2-keto-3-deoxy-L-rhamnonate aldolase RhmA